MKRLWILVAWLVLLTGCRPPEPVPVTAAHLRLPEPEPVLTVEVSYVGNTCSPLFPDLSQDPIVAELLHGKLLETDREGSMLLHGLTGEARPYQGHSYEYDGLADCHITQEANGSAVLDIRLREGVLFSDGEAMDIDDVIFTMYILLDPTYDGSWSLSSLPIVGLKEYQAHMQPRLSLILSAGPDAYQSNPYYSESQYHTFWDAFWSAGERFAQQIVDYCAEAGHCAPGDVTAAATAWGYPLEAGATTADFFGAIVARRGLELGDQGINFESAGTSISQFLYDALGDAVHEFRQGVVTGASATHISGIQKTGSHSLRLQLTSLSPAMLCHLSFPIAPLHHDGQRALYDEQAHRFGFPKGDLSHPRSVTETVGLGPYRVAGDLNTLEANPYYWRGCPKISRLQFQQSDVQIATLDTLDSTPQDGTLRMVPNLGYGCVGINAKTVCVDGEPGSEASKNLRKALATVICVYRETAVEGYFGSRAHVIQYPISDASWAAPRAGEPGYQAAFSLDISGTPLYREGMTLPQRQSVALAAALEYLAAAGYTVEEGMVTASPAGASLEYEVLVGGGGTGDHPTYAALAAARDALAQIGITLTVTDEADFSLLSATVRSGNAELFAFAWETAQDPDMYQIYHSQGISNRTYGIQDPALDEKILQALGALDQSQRRSLYRECFSILAGWAVEIPVYQRQTGVLFSHVLSVHTVPNGLTPFYSWAREAHLLEYA